MKTKLHKELIENEDTPRHNATIKCHGCDLSIEIGNPAYYSYLYKEREQSLCKCQEHELREEYEHCGFSATYSPEDNKLRLYTEGRFDKDMLALVHAAGFRWAGKQELFYSTWSPCSEDFLLLLVDIIDDESQSVAERAADRAERFSMYREKRRGEAHGHADNHDSMGSTFGHQDGRRAERQAMKANRVRGHALDNWSKAEYWAGKVQGVIAHANFKDNADLRKRRIVEIAKDLKRTEGRSGRWASHYKLRLDYETAILKEQGHTMPIDWVKGGTVDFKGKRFTISRVYKGGTYTKSVKLVFGDEKKESGLVCALSCGEYQAPTAESIAEAKGAKKPKAPAMLNRPGKHEMTLDEWKRCKSWGNVWYKTVEINDTKYRTPYSARTGEITITGKKIKDVEGVAVWV